MCPGQLSSRQPNERKCTTSVSTSLFDLATATPQAPIVRVLAVIVGYMVVAGSIFRSIPQIVRVVRNKSAEGVSVAAIVSETVAFLITGMYHVRKRYPFSSFGDMITCNIQNVILLGAIFRHRPDIPPTTIGLGSILLILFAYYLYYGCSSHHLWLLQASTIFIVTVGGKIPQVMVNIQRGNSGELSVLTSALNVAGSVARSFTHLTLTQDTLNLVGCFVMGFFNIVIFHQTLVTAGVYGSPRTKGKKVSGAH